jgi:hypothetical protein
MQRSNDFILKIIKECLNEEISFNNIKLNDNFYNWFGESKVIDKNGNPMICYHGTTKGGFEEFKPKIGYKGKSKQQVDLGSHFSIDKEYASGYAGNKKTSKIYESFLRIENPLYTNQMFYREDNEIQFIKYFDFITKVFKIKLTGDYFYDKKGDKQKEPQSIMINSFNIDKIPSNKLYNNLIDFGFDGIFHEPYNRVGLYQIKKHPIAYIILEPNQVKSIENNGNWSLNDNNIYN